MNILIYFFQMSKMDKSFITENDSIVEGGRDGKRGGGAIFMKVGI